MKLNSEGCLVSFEFITVEQSEFVRKVIQNYGSDTLKFIEAGMCHLLLVTMYLKPDILIKGLVRSRRDGQKKGSK